MRGSDPMTRSECGIVTSRTSASASTTTDHITDATGKTIRRITPGYLRQRLPRNNPIGMNQAYIMKVIDNPKTPECNRKVAIDFVIDNPEMFMPRPVDTPDRLLNEMNRRRNGNADASFLDRISAKRCHR